jgi:hypothetical protein
MDASVDGRNVFLATDEQLLGWDVDGNFDLYDARVEGGLPEPLPLRAPCVGDTCRPASPSSLSPSMPTTDRFAGPGNPRPKRCGKGRRTVRFNGRIKCIKKRHRAHSDRSNSRTPSGGPR